MDGVNAAGKRVSLLCDDAPAPSSSASRHPTSAKALQLPALPYHARPLPSTASAFHTRPGPRPLVHPQCEPSYSSRSCTSTSTTTSSSSSIAIYHSDSDSSLSRPSSISSPRYSPAVRTVPRLSRHDSSSSAQSLSTPSPMTPTHPFEPLDPQGKTISIDPSSYLFASLQPQAYNNMASGVAVAAGAATNAPFYPSPAQGALPVSASQTNVFGGFPALQQPPFVDDPYLAPPAQVQYQFATNLIEPLPPTSLGGASLASPTSLVGPNPNAPIPPVDSSNAPTNPNAPGSATKAKKKYPCPHAAKFNCHDTFTTSGHAARHGKKHTGEKNILCPTCHKAFTRKDNMKQHERTHKNNRNNDSVDLGKPTGHSRRTQSISSVAASTITQQSSNSNEMELDSPTVDGVDSKRNSVQRPNLGRPGQYSASNSNGSADFKLNVISQRPELNRQFSGESQDGEGESPGLDALAMAASGELR